MTLKYTTQITPAQWTFFVWDFTYFWVLAMYIYFLLALCRRYVPFVVFTHTIHMRLQCLATASHSRHDSIFVFFYLIYEKLHVENHPTWSRGNLDCLRAVIFSFDIADCSHAVLWVWLFPHRHSFSLSNNIIHAPHRNAYDWMYTMPAVLPYGFHVSIIISLCLNITWLFLYDRE